jgi:hypothetical protein
MPRNISTSNLILYARQAADMVNSDFCSDAEILALINVYFAELYDMLVSAYGQPYFAEYDTFNTVAGTEKYAFPSSDGYVYKIIGVDIRRTTTDFITLTPFNFHNRNDYQHYSNLYDCPRFYRWHGDYMWLIPTPTSTLGVTVHYIPCCPVLVGSLLEGIAEVVDGVNGWERYIVVCTAIAMLQKEQSDPSLLLAEKASLVQRINAMKQERDAGEVEQIVDKRGSFNRRYI